MKKFKFTLETLLNVTATLENEAKNKLAVINRQLGELIDTRTGFFREIEETQKLFESALTTGDFVNLNAYIESMKDRIEKISAEIAVKEDEKSKAQDELAEIMTKRKMYERLKEKQYFAYRKEVQREEEKILDDFISSNSGESIDSYG